MPNYLAHDASKHMAKNCVHLPHYSWKEVEDKKILFTHNNIDSTLCVYVLACNNYDVRISILVIENLYT